MSNIKTFSVRWHRRLTRDQWWTDMRKMVWKSQMTAWHRWHGLDMKSDDNKNRNEIEESDKIMWSKSWQSGDRHDDSEITVRNKRHETHEKGDKYNINDHNEKKTEEVHILSYIWPLLQIRMNLFQWSFLIFWIRTPWKRIRASLAEYTHTSISSFHKWLSVTQQLLKFSRKLYFL